MRNMIFLILLSLSLFAHAGPYDCEKVEYAELKDMSTEDQTGLFCKYRTNYLFKEYFFNKQMSIYKGNRNLMTSGTLNQMAEDQQQVNACKGEMQRVEKLLRAKNIMTENKECKCPQGYSKAEPFMRCSM